MRRLGILTAVDKNDPEGQRRIAAFVQGLRELGWTEAPTFTSIIAGPVPILATFATPPPNWSR
jgi:hypothetical protein